jgi:hypothetical protein
MSSHVIKCALYSWGGVELMNELLLTVFVMLLFLTGVTTK